MKDRLIAVCNLSTVIDVKTLDIMMEAASDWYTNTFQPFWPNTRAKIDVYPDIECLPEGSEHCLIVDDADMIGAAAYHTKTGKGFPELKVFARTLLLLGYTALGKQGVLSAFMHELGENHVDPGCNLWAEDDAGTEHALETVDGCQDNGYVIKVKKQEVWACDFLLPDWFDSRAPGTEFNYMSTIKSPFQVENGYDVTRKAGKINILPTEKCMPEYKASKYSRLTRRLINHAKECA